MAEASVAVKMPDKIPPITMTISKRAGIALKNRLDTLDKREFFAFAVIIADGDDAGTNHQAQADEDTRQDARDKKGRD